MTPSQALQRVIVRMLYDPALVERVYGGHTPAPLTAPQGDMLRAQPRGAWTTDPYRPSRTLQALIEEYPASAALTGVQGLHAFFQSATFHDAIMARQVLAIAFGDWLQPLVGAVSAFEQSVAGLRRRQPIPLPPGTVRCAPDRWPISLPAATLSAWQQLTQHLGAAPLQRLLEPGYRPPQEPGLRVPMQSPLEHWVLISDDGGQIQLSGGSAGVNGLLRAAAEPVPEDALLQVALSLGADDLREARALVNDFVAEGLLVSG